MRKILYNILVSDSDKFDPDFRDDLIKVVKTAISKKGFDSDEHDVFQFMLNYHNQKNTFPTLLKFKSSYPEFELVDDKVSNEEFQMYVKDIHLWLIDDLRRDIGLEYLDFKKTFVERQECLDKLAELERQLISVGDNIDNSKDYNSNDIIEDRAKHGDGPLTDIQDVDDLTGGITAGRMLVVAAPPKCGKTTFALNFAYNGVINYEEPNNTMFVTLEVSKKELHLKFIKRHSYKYGWNSRSIRDMLKGNIDEEDKKVIDEIEKDFFENQKSDFMYMDGTEIETSSISMFRQQFIDKIKKHDLKTIVFDYIQLMKDYPIGLFKDDYKMLNSIVDMFRRLAVEYNVRIILLSQINREGVKKAGDKDKKEENRGKFTMTHLAEVNSLERSLYYLLTFYVDDFLKAQHRIKYQFLAHRDGSTIEKPRCADYYPEYFFIGQHKGDIPNKFGVKNSNRNYNTTIDERIRSVTDDISDLDLLSQY